MKYQTAYFCGYAKLPSALPTTTTNGSITLGLKIDLETACIEDVSVTFLSNLALSMCREYFIGKNILRDYDEIVEEIGYRHQGAAAKSIIKAFGDIHRNYIEYMEKKRVISACAQLSGARRQGRCRGDGSMRIAQFFCANFVYLSESFTRSCFSLRNVLL